MAVQSGTKMAAWGAGLSARGRDEPIRLGNGPLSPVFIGQDRLRTYQELDNDEKKFHQTLREVICFRGR